MSQKISKFIAALMIAILFCTNFGTVISYAVEASINELESQGTSTDNANVQFDVYFDGGKHTNISSLEAQDCNLNISIKVKDSGYLKDIVVTMQDANYKLVEEEKEEVLSLDVQNNKINFAQINNGEEKKVSYKIVPDIQEEVSSDFFNKNNEITLDATYVNEKGKEEKINKTIVINKQWTLDTEAQLSVSLEKYIPYEINGESKILVQEKITSKVENNSLPIKTTKIEVEIPQLENKKLEDVVVIANTLEASNGATDGLEFGTSNWTYDETKEVVTINVKNSESGKIAWKKDVQDEYLVTFIYAEDIANENVNSIETQNEVTNTVQSSSVSTANEENRKIKSEITVYNNVEKTLSAEVENVIDTSIQVGDVVGVTEEVTSSVNKGYMYNNKNTVAENQKETDYSVTYKANIAYAKLVSKIEFVQNSAYFTTKDSIAASAVNGENYIYNKNVSISKKVFDKILGEDGYFRILKADGTEVASINKDTVVDEQGNIVIDISNYNLNTITIETSAPKTEGNIEITVNKAISKEVAYSLEQIKEFTGIRETVNNNIEAIINLEEPTAKADIVINQDALSTVVENENVEIKATLPMNSIDDLMYVNPVVRIDLPEYINEVNVTNVQLLYTDELTLGESYLVDNSDGGKSFILNLQGTQTKYSTEDMVNGPTIVITANIGVSKLAPSREEAITMYSILDDEVVAIAADSVSISAPAGLVTLNSVENYSNNGEKIETIETSSNAIAILDTYSATRNAKITGQIINNQSNEISNIKILGRIPSNGQNSNTFDLKLSSAITVSDSNAKVYYSSNINATNDLTLTSNAWQENVTDHNEVKSFLIVKDDANMGVGSDISFSYTVTVPEQLMHNNHVTTSYEVAYTNLSTLATTNEFATSPVITMQTNDGADLQVELTSNVPQENTVYGKQFFTFTVKVKNIGVVEAENAKIILNLPEELTHVKYVSESASFEEQATTIDIGDLAVGESFEGTYMVQCAQGEKDLEITASATSGNMDSKITSNVYKLKLEMGYIELQEHAKLLYDDTIFTKGSKLEVTVKLYNLSEKDLTNVTVTQYIPEGFKVTSYGKVENVFDLDKTGMNIGTNKVTYTANKVEAGSYLEFEIIAEVENEQQGQKQVYAEVTSNESGTVTSNSLFCQMEKANFAVSSVKPSNQYVKEGQEVTYEFNITNNGNALAQQSVISCKMPDGVTFVSAEIVKANGSTKKIVAINGDIFTYKDSGLGQSETVKITVRTNALPNKDDKEIPMALEFYADNVDKISTDKIIYIIEYDEEAHQNAIDKDNEDKPVNPTTPTYKITGKVWNDVNADGKRDDDEEGIADVEVILLDANTTKVVKDGVKTKSSGSYEFSNLEKGEYLVVFIYPESKYKITEYNKTDVAQSINSDAISTKITYNGQQINAGVTNTIKITDSNARNIDLGLIETEKFDLSLEKKISKITVYNGQTTESLDYSSNPKDLAKIDIKDKYLDSSTVTVEYTIKVTNEGQIAGYAKNIVDYMPSDLKFSSEINPLWYQGKDGNLYTTALANTIINSGESKTVILTLSKKMTKTNTGTVNNRAEIYESYNEQAVADINSTPGNKKDGENDMDSVDLIITVKTGETVTYTFLGITIAAIVAFGVFEVKRKVIDKKI